MHLEQLIDDTNLFEEGLKDKLLHKITKNISTLLPLRRSSKQSQLYQHISKAWVNHHVHSVYSETVHL